MFGVLNQEMIATSLDSWCGLDVILYTLSSRGSILRMKFILPLLRAILAPTGSVSSADWRPELTFQSTDRSQEAEQYKCLKGRLDSIPFHLFSFLFPTKICSFFVSVRGDSTFVDSQQHCHTADLAVSPFFFFWQLTLCLMLSLWCPVGSEVST